VGWNLGQTNPASPFPRPWQAARLATANDRRAGRFPLGWLIVQRNELSGIPQPLFSGLGVALTGDAIARLQSGENLNSLLLITSPIDGVVLEKSASAGQRLDSATPLFNVARLQPLGLEIQAQLASLQGLRVGAEVTIPAYAASGKLTAIGQSLSDSSQTILLRALILKGAQNLRPGQHVDVSITTRSVNTPQWNIPNSALARVDGKVVIFVETATGFHAETVTVLHEGAQDSLVTGKLGGTEKIAIHGVSALKAKLMGIGGAE